MSRLTHKLICQTCSKDFEGKKIDSKNCSKECRVKAGHIQRKKVNDEKLAQKMALVEPRSCKICNELFIPHKTKINIQVYCGPVCQQKDMHIMRTQKPGYKEQRAAYKREWVKASKEKIRSYYYDGNFILCLERDNYTCCRCGETRTNKLHVHHKDHSGRTENPNHSLDNLETLCHSCHKKHHASQKVSHRKKIIPDETIIQAIESSLLLSDAAKKLNVHDGWIYTWHAKNWEKLNTITCPVCNQEFKRRKFRGYCSMKCVRKGNENTRMFPVKKVQNGLS